MGNCLVLVGDELDLVAVRQIGNAQCLPEHHLANIGVDVSRNVCRQALDLDLAQHLLQYAALQLDAGSLALQQDRHADDEQFVHSDALQVHMQQRALDRLMLPVDDHHLARIVARCHVEDGVVALLGMEDAADLLGIYGEV